VRRSFGESLGHTLAAWTSITRGLDRVEADEADMRSELEAHWEVVAEGAQTILRAANIPSAYEQLKSLTRGKEISQESYQKWVEALNVDENVKSKLQSLSPLSYVGLAEEITEFNLSRRWNITNKKAQSQSDPAIRPGEILESE
jgi:adenylosuccinate lyase